MKVLIKKQCMDFLDLAAKRTAQYIKDNHLARISLGISGGIDSAVVGIIGLKALAYLKKDNYLTAHNYMFLDCKSDPYDYQKAKALSEKFNFKLRYVDLNKWYKASPLLKSIPKNHRREKISQANIKCRLRMISIYNSASINGYIYLDTDDLSEEWMGFWTRHGDEGDVKIIQHITKIEVYDIAEFLGIPDLILKSKPADGLKVTEGSLAEHQLGLDYFYIEYIMSRFIGEGFDYNGSFNQLKKRKYKNLLVKVANEIKRSTKEINYILNQSLKTAYKRKYGDNVCHLLPDRKEFGFPKIGTKDFNQKYLKAILT
jgi:NAD+ synthase